MLGISGVAAGFVITSYSIHYTKLYEVLWILIPLVTVFLTIIYAHIHGPLNLNEAVRHIIYGVVFTAGVWLGCMYFVQIFWHKFPWEHYPVKHLIIEVLVITSYTLIFSFSFYYLCVHYGFIEPLKRSLAEEIFDTLLIVITSYSIHYTKLYDV